MKNLKKTSVLTLSTVLSLGILVPTVSATTVANEQQEKLQIRIASTETVVTKSELIKKFREVFPNTLHFLKDSDFDMSSGHHYPDDDTIRYDLSFYKDINGKQLYGSVVFKGENLEVEHFYYEPTNSADALFPGTVTEAEAEKIALAFLNKFTKGNEYQLEASPYYDSINQPLTEPIRYSFSFVRTENQVPISDQMVNVTVLGNGEIVQFYNSSMSGESQTFADITKVLDKNEILKRVKENLSIDLQYQIDFDYQTGDRHVNLVYQPTSQVLGVHALSGEWQTANGFTPNVPKSKEIEFITDKPLKPKQTDFSVEKAKPFAEKFLAVDSDKVTLNIESIDEIENYNGQEVISIQYMYEYRNGGYGTNLELDKQTGEVIQYHDIKSEVLAEMNEETKNGKTISSDKALQQAVKYLKEFAPSYLHNYAIPIEEAHFEKERGSYHFSFPRIVDGILVNGDLISVSVSANGTLLDLSVNYQDIEEWPTTEEILSKEEAKAEFIKQLSLDLRYAKESYMKEDEHYHLVYTPVFNESPFSFLDANTGKWNSIIDEENDRPVVSHSWAEDELNFLIQAGILEVEDAKTFDANTAVTQGDAIEVVMRSLTHFYDGYNPDQENERQSFENIDPDHPLYQVIERAVTIGILDTKHSTFNPDAHLTREELSVWYVRALGLEKAAKNSSIYQLNFADANKVQAEYIGYVALANSLGLLKGSNGQFNPDQELTYAQLAVSVIRLAHEAYESGTEIYY